jgi:hypothetical protein
VCSDRPHDERRPVAIACRPQIALGRFPLAFVAPGDEEHRHALCFRRVEEGKRGFDRRGPAQLFPGEDATRAIGQPAWAVADVAEIVGDELGPVRQRGLVDIEHERGARDLAGALLHMGLRGAGDRREIALIAAGVVIIARLLLEVADVLRLRGRDIDGGLRGGWAGEHERGEQCGGCLS